MAQPGLTRLRLRRRGADSGGGGNVTGAGLAATQVVVADSTSSVTSYPSFTFVDTTATLDVAKARSGAAVTVSARNTSNTASSSAVLLAEVAGASAGNPSLRLTIAGVKAWVWQVNNSVANDPLQLLEGANTYLQVSTAGIVDLAPNGTLAAGVHRFRVQTATGGLPAGPRYTGSGVSSGQFLHFTPDDTNTSGAGVAVLVHDSAAGAYKGVLSAVNRAGPPQVILAGDGGTVGVGGAATSTHSFDVFASSSGATVSSTVRNTSNTASSGAMHLVEVAGASAGDPSLRLSIAGVQTWDVLSSNATSDQLQLLSGATVVQRWSTAGDVAIGTTTDSTYRLKIGKASAAQVFVNGTGGGAFASVRVGATESEAALMEGYANDSGVTLLGIAAADKSFFYANGGHEGAVYGTLSATGIVFFAPGNTPKARITAGGNLIIGAVAVADVATTAFRVDAARTVASAAGAVWDGLDVISSTLTITGSTNITTATGVNLVALRAPTLSAGTALTVTNAATLYIAGAPAGAGAGPATITNSYAVWVDAGIARFDGNGTNVFELADGPGTLGLSLATGTIRIRVAGANKFLRYFDD